jgi:hypothetical protein
MPDLQPAEFPLGTTWPISIDLKDEDDVALVLGVGDDVQMRIALSARGPVLWSLSTANGDGSITGPSQVEFLITPQMQVTAGLEARNIRHESRVVLANGNIIPQAFGVITVAPSLFSL